MCKNNGNAKYYMKSKKKIIFLHAFEGCVHVYNMNVGVINSITHSLSIGEWRWSRMCLFLLPHKVQTSTQLKQEGTRNERNKKRYIHVLEEHLSGTVNYMQNHTIPFFAINPFSNQKMTRILTFAGVAAPVTTFFSLYWFLYIFGANLF